MLITSLRVRLSQFVRKRQPQPDITFHLRYGSQPELDQNASSSSKALEIWKQEEEVQTTVAKLLRRKRRESIRIHMFQQTWKTMADSIKLCKYHQTSVDGEASPYTSGQHCRLLKIAASLPMFNYQHREVVVATAQKGICCGVTYGGSLSSKEATYSSRSNRMEPITMSKRQS